MAVPYSFKAKQLLLGYPFHCSPAIAQKVESIGTHSKAQPHHKSKQKCFSKSQCLFILTGLKGLRPIEPN